MAGLDWTGLVGMLNWVKGGVLLNEHFFYHSI